MICVSDTNILSSFLGVDRLTLLLAALETDHVLVPAQVLDELNTGVLRGYLVEPALRQALESGALQPVVITVADEERIQRMPTAFGAGEQQAVAVALRLALPLLSNDRRVVSYCRTQQLLCLDLPTLLRLIWRRGTASKDEVRALMQDMSSHEGIIFRHVERIFADAVVSDKLGTTK